MDRIEKLREFIDDILLNKNNDRDRRMAYVHLYGVAQSCAFIAKKRGVSVELAVMAGMLHDLYTYKKKDEVRHLGKDKINEVIKNHAVNGAIYAREVLNELQLTTVDETNAICLAIHNHSSKDGKFSKLDEVLIDADVMQHYFYNPLNPIAESGKERLDKLLSEFGMNPS